MALRRSARVQTKDSVPTVPILAQQNSLKRAFKTTKSGTRNAEKPLEHLNEARDENEPPSSPPHAEQGTPNKRRKLPLKKPTPKAAIADPSPLPVGYPTDDIANEVSSTNTTRPAEPHITNAPLASPKDGDIKVAYSNFEWESTQTDALDAPTPTTTTSTLLEEAISHLLKTDTTGRLAPVIANHHCHAFSPTGLAEPVDPFRSLASAIMGQQVSGAAATSIKNKFIALFPADAAASHPGPPQFPSPDIVAGTPIPTLRTAGLSERKAEYIQGLAARFASGELSAEMLLAASDEEVMEKLVAVRGLGKWSVEMFMCFGLKRMNVFSVGDLGIQRGMAAYIGKDVSKLRAKGGGKWKYMSEEDMLAYSAPFAPYRSLFMWYMWRISDVSVEAIQNA